MSSRRRDNGSIRSHPMLLLCYGRLDKLEAVLLEMVSLA